MVSDYGVDSNINLPRQPAIVKLKTDFLGKTMWFNILLEVSAPAIFSLDEYSIHKTYLWLAYVLVRQGKLRRAVETTSLALRGDSGVLTSGTVYLIITILPIWVPQSDSTE